MVLAVIPDPSRCVYCFECMLACSSSLEGEFAPAKARMRVLESRAGHGLPIVCVQCPEHPCVDACPTGALRVEGGIVKVDEASCVACGTCASACPIGAVRVLGGRAVKCQVCSEEPPCVKICPSGALRVVDAPDEERERALRLLIELTGGG
ncbi:MAG TPA: 4Fe-4S dicluster domain-containing protein [Candidatus Korarchaeota archaeon]|nr:4Fe-4S dicluster domain-containing protein [Candidatus Korarchaeota archaeon]